MVMLTFLPACVLIYVLLGMKWMQSVTSTGKNLLISKHNVDGGDQTSGSIIE